MPCVSAAVVRRHASRHCIPSVGASAVPDIGVIGLRCAGLDRASGQSAPRIGLRSTSPGGWAAPTKGWSSRPFGPDRSADRRPPQGTPRTPDASSRKEEQHVHGGTDRPRRDRGRLVARVRRAAAGPAARSRDQRTRGRRGPRRRGRPGRPGNGDPGVVAFGLGRSRRARRGDRRRRAVPAPPAARDRDGVVLGGRRGVDRRAHALPPVGPDPRGRGRCADRAALAPSAARRTGSSPCSRSPATSA
jgi:hypothetical protein